MKTGSPLFSDAKMQFPIRYYIIAMLFVIFDIEIVFMFPWAWHFKLGLVGFGGDGGVYRYFDRRVLVRMEKGRIGVGLAHGREHW